MVTKIYLFPIYLLIGLIWPHKIKCPFHKSFFLKTCHQLCKILNYQSSCSLTCITRSSIIMHIFTYSWPPISNIFLYVILVAKCPHASPSCNSFITICVFVIIKHHYNLLSWPILYNSPFFSVNGSIFLTNLCLYSINNVFSICHVLKNSFTSFSHSSFA
jgi:hypothetical protein